MLFFSELHWLYSGIISFLLVPSYLYSWRIAYSLFSLAIFNLAGVSCFSLGFPALTFGLAVPVSFFFLGHDCVNCSVLRPKYAHGSQEYQLFHCVFTTELWLKWNGMSKHKFMLHIVSKTLDLPGRSSVYFLQWRGSSFKHNAAMYKQSGHIGDFPWWWWGES